jgi:hypothetical protein
VAELTDNGVLLTDGSELAASAVVVATGPDAARALLPELGHTPTRGVVTYYHAARQSPLAEPTLMTDAARRILNTAVISDVNPLSSPDHRALVATSVLPGAHGSRETEVRSVLGELYGTDTTRWELLAAYHVEEALPAMVPPWPLSRTTRIAPGRYVCGDHRSTGSVQGALASAGRAAREVLRDVHAA